MEDQNYKNHVRYYPPHHFVFYPVVLILTGLCVYFSIQHPEQQLIWLMMGGIILLVAWVSFMLRQHYALMNQDRIVRLEMRLRYYILTKKRLEEVEHKLSLGQILALRFASDAELPDLVQQAIDKKLSPDQIKQAIKNWEPDYMRV